MKALAFAVGVAIFTVGAIGVLAPSSLVWIAERFVTSDAFYVLATVRVAFGLLLVSVAPTSRAPRALRVLGFVIVVAGITTALTSWLAIGAARHTIASWLRQGPVVVRLTGVPIVALGGFVAYACAPGRPRRGMTTAT